MLTLATLCVGRCRSQEKQYLPPETEVVALDFASVRLGDRSFVGAVLTDVFGPSVAASVARNVHANPAAFGGPCLLYEQVFYDSGGERVGIEDPSALCIGGMPALNQPLVGASSTLRAGWLKKVCSDATGDPQAMAFAMRSIFGDSPVTAPDAATIVAAYHRFFPGRELPETAGVSLAAISPQASPQERWNKVFFVLCLTPDWQIP